MTSSDKPLAWMHGEGKSLPFSPAARVEAGMLLRRTPVGRGTRTASFPSDAPSVGGGGHELRVIDGNASWRLVYYLGRDAVVILGVFSKKTEATPQSVIASCQRRLAAYVMIVKERAR